MTDVKQQILEEIELHLNEIVMSLMFHPARLVGFAEDPNDYYYILEHVGGNRFYDSCVGQLIYLKNLPKRDYEMLESVFDLNNSPRVDKMVVEKLDELNGELLR